MKLFGIGKRVLPPSSQTICGQNDGVREARSWYVDGTYVKVQGKWCYLYRAIDQDGNLVDSRLSEKRDMDAAKQFFKQALGICGHAPEHITTDGHRSYPRAIHETIGNEVAHLTNTYLNNRIEQDHRSIKQRYYPMLGIGNFMSATSFCLTCDELHHYVRPRSMMGETVSLAQQRWIFCERFVALHVLMEAVS